MQIIDDFLPPHRFIVLEEILMGSEFPWYYNPYTIREGEDPTGLRYQFTHSFLRDTGERSPAFSLLDPLWDKIAPKEIIRAKLNLGPRDTSHVEGGWHTDYTGEFAEGITSATYYLNDNDGYTLFKDGTKVESKKNRLAIFPCLTEHTAVSHTDTQTRVVLNLNYRV